MSSIYHHFGLPPAKRPGAKGKTNKCPLVLKSKVLCVKERNCTLYTKQPRKKIDQNSKRASTANISIGVGWELWNIEKYSVQFSFLRYKISEVFDLNQSACCYIKATYRNQCFTILITWSVYFVTWGNKVIFSQTVVPECFWSRCSLKSPFKIFRTWKVNANVQNFGLLISKGCRTGIFSIFHRVVLVIFDMLFSIFVSFISFGQTIQYNNVCKNLSYIEYFSSGFR